MVKKKDDIPNWVIDEIKNAKFQKPEEIKRTGYIFDIFEKDKKMEVWLYDPVEDGRHQIDVDLSKKIKIADLQKGVVYEFTFDQLKAPLSKKVAEFLQKEKEFDMNAIYQFELKGMKLIDSSSEPSSDIEE